MKCTPNTLRDTTPEPTPEPGAPNSDSAPREKTPRHAGPEFDAWFRGRENLRIMNANRGHEPAFRIGEHCFVNAHSETGPPAGVLHGHRRSGALQGDRFRGRNLAILVTSLWLFSGNLRARAGFADDWIRMKSIVPQGYVCYRTTGPVTVDGRLDEPAWQKAEGTPDFQDIEGGAKAKPRFRTRAKMLWDDQYFYVAVELEEPHVWAMLTNHDAVIFQDNDFEVFIDPNGDSHEYYEFEMNALNTGWDLLLKKPYKDGGPALNEWEIPGLKTAVHVAGTINNPTDRDLGWSVEIAFPWKVLAEYAPRRTPPDEGDQWRVNFSRVEWQINIVNGKYEKIPDTREDNWVWSPQGIIDMHRPEKWGYVQFTRKQMGEVKFGADPARPARDALQEIYYVQRDYEAKNHRWASSLDELGLSADFSHGLAKPPGIHVSKDGFEATAKIKLPDGRIERWHIRQDARVWMD